MKDLIIVGGGLAGTEAAWQAAERGIKVSLLEMRPTKYTSAHKTANLAELVCSNSFGSVKPDRPSGLLKQELKLLNSFLLECAYKFQLPAGSSLSVDRDKYSEEVTDRIACHPNIELIHIEITEIPFGPCIIASGPLTSANFAKEIEQFTGTGNLFFYDAIAPRLTKEGIDFSIAFYGSRYGVGSNMDGDYINCPLTKKEYEILVEELSFAKCNPQKDFENQRNYFEACLPIEEIARRSKLALAFGPIRPVGITNPNSKQKPYAVVQLRQDNLSGSLYNMVGFQTNLAYPEQERIFHMIPGLKDSVIAQYGQMHRNTFICSPKILLPTMQTRAREDLLFAGQIAGVEGYLGSIATGLVAGINIARLLKQQPVLTYPESTMLGALCNYISSTAADHFQPIKANFGILPELPNKINSKKDRSHQKYSRAISEMQHFIHNNNL